MREKALGSFWYFVTNVIDYSEASSKVLFEPLHRPVCDTLQEEETQLLLLPRGHLKSTLVSIYYPLWILCKYPDTSILMASATLGRVSDWFKKQLKIIKENDLLRWLFSELDPGPGLAEFGFAEHFTIPGKASPWPDPSVRIVSLERNTAGLHCDVLIVDDSVTEENSNTAEGLKRPLEWLRMQDNVLMSRGFRTPKRHMKIVGTRYHFDDAYGVLQKEGMRTTLRKAIEDGKPIFPKTGGLGFSMEELEEKKRIQRHLFWSQMMNEPLSSEDAVFKREDIERCVEQYPVLDKALLDSLTVVITVDLAISQKERADDTAIAVSGIDGKGRLFDLDCVAGKMLPDATIDHIYRLFDQWGAAIIYVEQVGYQQAFEFIMREEARKRGRWLPVRPTKTQSKNVHIWALQPMVANHEFFIRRENRKLIEQMERWYPSSSQHDDVLDAFAMRMQEGIWTATTPPKTGADPMKVVVTHGDWDKSDAGQQKRKAMEFVQRQRSLRVRDELLRRIPLR